MSIQEFINEEISDKIVKIEYDSTLNNNVVDYNFYIIKLNMFLKNDSEKKNLYIKFINKDKIKESIFCFWTMLYDEQTKDKYIKENEDDFYIRSSINISEIKQEKANRRCVHLTIKNNDLNILKYGTTIHLIEIDEYLKRYKDNKLHDKWKKYFYNLEDYFLMICIT